MLTAPGFYLGLLFGRGEADPEKNFLSHAAAIKKMLGLLGGPGHAPRNILKI